MDLKDINAIVPPGVADEYGKHLAERDTQIAALQAQVADLQAQVKSLTPEQPAQTTGDTAAP